MTANKSSESAGKASAKKAVAKKPVAKKATVKKASTKKPVAKKPVAKKAAVQKAAPKKAAATQTKASVKKAVAQKASPKKAAPAPKTPDRKKAASRKPAGSRTVRHSGAVVVSSKRAASAGGDDAVLLKRKAEEANDFHLVKKASKKRIKSYSQKDLDRFRKALVETRIQLMDQVNYLRNTSLTREDIGFSEEDGTDAFQRQIALNLAGREGDSITAIDDAVRRIDEGTYGVCEECACLIEKARLEALPFASLCITCKSDMEKRNGGRDR